jgi:acetylornithine deacetylase/succinyl-diaminopimelate desuccinylase-like protein
MSLPAAEQEKPRQEVGRLLQELIRIDSTNPPGNEMAVACYLHDLFVAHGIESKVIESAPGRGNVIARLRGSGKKAPLILLGHLDVVPAKGEEWDLPPFAGRIEGGSIWGRGAIDMKGMVAIEVTAFLEEARRSLAGDLVFVGVADEEAGGVFGAQFLIEHHWDDVRGAYVLNEGSIGMRQAGVTLYPIQVAEKGVLWLKLVAHGTAGHGSMPYADNAVVHLTRALNRLANIAPPVTVTPVVREFLRRRGARLPFPERLVSSPCRAWIVRSVPSSGNGCKRTTASTRC